jgi:hypothetical protein
MTACISSRDVFEKDDGCDPRFVLPPLHLKKEEKERLAFFVPIEEGEVAILSSAPGAGDMVDLDCPGS